MFETVLLSAVLAVVLRWALSDALKVAPLDDFRLMDLGVGNVPMWKARQEVIRSLNQGDATSYVPSLISHGVYDSSDGSRLPCRPPSDPQTRSPSPRAAGSQRRLAVSVIVVSAIDRISFLRENRSGGSPDADASVAEE